MENNKIRTEEEQKEHEEGFRNAIRESMKDGSLFRVLTGKASTKR
jgi:hypothetical protein